MIVPQVVTAPARYPVSLAEARNQLGIDTQDDDPRLAGLLAAATSSAETYLGRSLITRSFKGFLDCWPWWSGSSSIGLGLAPSGVWPRSPYAGRFIELPRPPLISVEYVKTYDDSDVATTMSASDYFVDGNATVGRLALRTSASWPVPTRTANGIEIAWTAGYGPNPADIPEEIRLGIQMLVGSLNEQRGDEVTPPTMPPAALALLSPYRLHPV